MPHENSETVQGQDGRWININGETRERLVPMFSFEADSYDTMEAADAAAKRRSVMFGQGQPTVPGESPPPASAPGPPPASRIVPLRIFLSNDPAQIEAWRQETRPPMGAEALKIAGTPPAKPLTDPAGGAQILGGLKGPLFSARGFRRFEPPTLTDVEPFSARAEADITRYYAPTSEWPRPFELVSPREAESFPERDRISAILNLLHALWRRGITLGGPAASMGR